MHIRALFIAYVSMSHTYLHSYSKLLFLPTVLPLSPRFENSSPVPHGPIVWFHNEGLPSLLLPQPTQVAGQGPVVSRQDPRRREEIVL